MSVGAAKEHSRFGFCTGATAGHRAIDLKQSDSDPSQAGVCIPFGVNGFGTVSITGLPPTLLVWRRYWKFSRELPDDRCGVSIRRV
jgi:hypothetical protein